MAAAAKSSDGEVPESFICPIGEEIMTDPVFDALGHTYERKNIEAWFALGRKTCPLSGETVPFLSLSRILIVSREAGVGFQ